MTIRAALLSIGDELVRGERMDRHASWLADRLGALGIVPWTHRTVGDDRALIASSLAELAAHSDIVIATGGLGPTADDLTRFALGDVIQPGQDLVEDERARAALERRYASRGREIPTSNYVQVQRPEAARFLANPNGTAPGLAATVGACRVWLLPGPPREMHPMYQRFVEAELRSDTGDSSMLVREVHMHGLGESAAAERLGELLARGRDPIIGITVSDSIVTARIRTLANLADAESAVESDIAAVDAAWAPLVFGHDGETLSSSVGHALLSRGLTLASAESCTAGMVAARIVETSGASDWFNGGWVTYSNDMKVSCLGVDAEVLAAHGAVSEPVAAMMAQGAMERGEATCGVSTTGIAGPSGAVPGKPVGTVFIGVACRDENGAPDVRVHRFEFPGTREQVRLRTVNAVLQLLRLRLEHPRHEERLLWEVALEGDVS